MKLPKGWKIFNVKVTESAKKRAAKLGKLTGIGSFRPANNALFNRFKIVS